MTRAIIYLRSATGNCAQTSRQEADCQDYLRERDLTEAGIYTDDGKSGPALAQLIAAATTAGITDVVVSELSRLGRERSINLSNFEALDDAGITVHAATGTITGPIGEYGIRDFLYTYLESGDDARQEHTRSNDSP